MPNYPWLIDSNMKVKDLGAKIRVMQTLGVPYPEGYDATAINDLNTQAQKIVDGLVAQGVETTKEKEIIALIAYLQRLGTDITKPGIENATGETNESH